MSRQTLLLDPRSTDPELWACFGGFVIRWPFPFSEDIHRRMLVWYVMNSRKPRINPPTVQGCRGKVTAMSHHWVQYIVEVERVPTFQFQPFLSWTSLRRQPSLIPAVSFPLYFSPENLILNPLIIVLILCMFNEALEISISCSMSVTAWALATSSKSWKWYTPNDLFFSQIYHPFTQTYNPKLMASPLHIVYWGVS